MRRTSGAAVAALSALAAVAPVAHAHGGGGTDYSSDVRAVAPAEAGISVQVLDRDDRLALRNGSGRTVVVEGYGGEPYARLRADGTVEVNERSPALYLNEDRFADVDVPATADEDAPVRWRVVDRSGRFEWHDHRIHWMGAERPERVRDPERRTKIFDWRVPLRVGEQRGSVTGTLTWVGRPGGGFPLGAALALAALVIGGAAFVAIVRRRRVAALAAVAALVLVTTLAPSASAHAVVEQTQPGRGAALDRAPREVVVAFDEPVESSFGALRVFDAGGGRVDRGELRRPGGDSIAVRLADDLPDGPYTVTYRVVSADSHPVAGGYVFTVGRAGGRPAAAVAELLDSGTGPVTEVAFGAARALGYAAIALLAGGALFVLAVWQPALRSVGRARHDADAAGDGWTAAATAFEQRATALLVAAAVVGAVATAAGIVLQAATATGGSFWSALDAGLLHDVLNTRFGDVWKLRFSAFAALAALLLLAPRRATATPDGPGALGAVRATALAVALACLVVSPALAGHANAGADRALLVPLAVLHVAAMSAWVGGVALLALAVPAATRRLAPADRGALLARLVPRVSTVALGAVALLLATGIAQSLLQLGAPADLVETAFGRAILVKAALLAVLVALGTHNRLRSQPALKQLAERGDAPGATGQALRRVLRAEIALMAAVLCVTAALVSYSPSAAAPGGPFSTTADLGPARAELTVDPARAGRNAVHLYLFDRATGAQYDRPRRVGIAASEPERGIGPLRLDVRKAGPGHYTAPRADLAPGGDWVLTVSARLSEFEELRGRIEVPIR
jgi:copper transport protein